MVFKLLNCCRELMDTVPTHRIKERKFTCACGKKWVYVRKTITDPKKPTDSWWESPSPTATKKKEYGPIPDGYGLMVWFEQWADVEGNFEGWSRDKAEIGAGLNHVAKQLKLYLLGDTPSSLPIQAPLRVPEDIPRIPPSQPKPIPKCAHKTYCCGHPDCHKGEHGHCGNKPTQKD